MPVAESYMYSSSTTEYQDPERGNGTCEIRADAVRDSMIANHSVRTPRRSTYVFRHMAMRVACVLLLATSASAFSICSRFGQGTTRRVGPLFDSDRCYYGEVDENGMVTGFYSLGFHLLKWVQKS